VTPWGARRSAQAAQRPGPRAKRASLKRGRGNGSTWAPLTGWEERLGFDDPIHRPSILRHAFPRGRPWRARGAPLQGVFVGWLRRAGADMVTLPAGFAALSNHVFCSW
jgi:hypothetical protein